MIYVTLKLGWAVRGSRRSEAEGHVRGATLDPDPGPRPGDVLRGQPRWDVHQRRTVLEVPLDPKSLLLSPNLVTA